MPSCFLTRCVSRGAAAGLLLILGLTACAAEYGAPEGAEVEHAELALNGGFVAGAYLEELYGTATVWTEKAPCSGVAITSTMVITAAHCGSEAIRVYFLGRWYLVAESVRHPKWLPNVDWDQNKTGYDIMAVFLDEPLRNRDGSEWERTRALWNSSGASAEGEPLWCFGIATGQYKYGAFEGIDYVPDSANQVPGGLLVDGNRAGQQGGDSGGPCFSRNSPFRLVGLNSGVLLAAEYITPLDTELGNWLFWTSVWFDNQ